jgi:hypothetical protein
MSAISCAWVRERAPELALGVLHGGERAETLLHVAGCARCQALVTELTEVADALPLAVPEAEPSPGFGGRVVAAMGGDRRRARRRRILTLAATAAAAAIISVTLVRVIDAGRDLPRQAAAPVLRSVPMRAIEGNPVGRVVVSGGSPAALLVNVDYAVADGEYRLELVHDGAKPSRLGTISVVDGRGSWRGTSPMVAGGNTLAMVDAAGTTVCDALLTVPTVS